MATTAPIKFIFDLSGLQEARKLTRGLLDDARKLNRELAQLDEEQLERLGIKLTYEPEEKKS